MWEYKIFKTDLWFWIYKKQEKEKSLSLWFLAGDEKRTLMQELSIIGKMQNQL